MAETTISGLMNDPNYLSALNALNEVTGGKPDYYKSVNDLATMAKLDQLIADKRLAAVNYWNRLEDPDAPLVTDINKVHFLGEPDKVGMVDGKKIYTSFGNVFGDEYYLSGDGSKVKYKEEDSGGLGGAALSLLSGGMSDVVQGDMPGQGISNLGPVAQVLNPVTFGLNAGTGGLSDLAYGYEKASNTEGDFWDKLAAGADRAVDINGAVDVATRATGDEINRAAPEVVPYIKPIATTVGTIIYPGAGTAAGYGIGAKLEDGTRTKDYLGDLKGAGVAYLGGAAGGAVGNTVGSATGSHILGGAAGGATSGVVSSTPQAIKEGSWSPLVRGGLTGAVVGGLGGAARELGDLNRFGESLGKAGSTAYDGGSTSYDGGVNYVPVGAGSLADSTENPTTLTQLMTELETPSGGGMSLATDPIPTESNPVGTPEFSATALPDTDTSSMNITESFQYAEPAYKTAKTAYNLYNIGKGVYDNYQNYQDAKDQTQQPVQQPIQPVQTPITAPVGVSYTLGNMPIGEEERRAWGRVLV